MRATRCRRWPGPHPPLRYAALHGPKSWRHCRARENPTDAEAIEAVHPRLRTDWPRYAIVEITQPLMELAGEYADTFALRGYDSVQLAAARNVQQAAGEELHFACFDARLQKAARMLGMPTRA